MPYAAPNAQPSAESQDRVAPVRFVSLDACETALDAVRRRLDRVDGRHLGNMALISFLLIALGGCQTSGGLQTGDVQRSIDPSYTVAPEDQADGRRRSSDDEDLSPYLAEAAASAIAEGDVGAAAILLSELHVDRPRDMQVSYDLARHLRYLGALERAEQVLQDAIAIHGSEPLLQLELAKLRIAGGRAEEAMLILDRLLAELPEDPGVLQAAGVALDRLGRHDEAQARYELAMAQGRPSASLLNNAGMSHLLSGDVDRAIELLREATVAPGASSQVRQNLATALALAGRADEARDAADGAAPSSISDPAIAELGAIPTTADAWSLASDD